MEPAETPLSLSDPRVVALLRKVYIAGIDYVNIVMCGILAQPLVHPNSHVDKLVRETIEVLLVTTDEHKQAAAEEAFPNAQPSTTPVE